MLLCRHACCVVARGFIKIELLWCMKKSDNPPAIAKKIHVSTDWWLVIFHLLSTMWYFPNAEKPLKPIILSIELNYSTMHWRIQRVTVTAAWAGASHVDNFCLILVNKLMMCLDTNFLLLSTYFAFTIGLLDFAFWFLSLLFPLFRPVISGSPRYFSSKDSFTNEKNYFYCNSSSFQWKTEHFLINTIKKMKKWKKLMKNSPPPPQKKSCHSKNQDRRVVSR